MDPAQHPVLGIDSFSSAPTHITHQNKSCHLFTMGQWSDLIGPNALFNLYAEYIMRNAGLEEAQAGIKIARRNINNPR